MFENKGFIAPQTPPMFIKNAEVPSLEHSASRE
jgi:hypothetical protein